MVLSAGGHEAQKQGSHCFTAGRAVRVLRASAAEPCCASFDTCSIERADVFRAVVAFYFESIPHHVLGEWQRSKKLAQRDVADRALRLCVPRWRKDVSRETQMERDRSRPVPLLEHRLRDEFCSLAVPEWSVEWTGEQARATVHLYGVEHSFQGRAQGRQGCRHHRHSSASAVVLANAWQWSGFRH